MGVNDRVQLARAEAAMQRRLRAKAMLGGATLIAPETVFFAMDAKIGRDVLIEPHVVIGPGVEIADGAVIHAFSHLEGARMSAGASIGPYARLRPGADIAEKAKVGNFVEIKAARIEAGAKVNHLSYIGDARVGAGANIGAGTITCNYDGFDKHKTDIGAGAFIGSNSSLVAPVKIGDGAYVGSGSVITKDVEPTPWRSRAAGRRLGRAGPRRSGRGRRRGRAAPSFFQAFSKYIQTFCLESPSFSKHFFVGFGPFQGVRGREKPFSCVPNFLPFRRYLLIRHAIFAKPRIETSKLLVPLDCRFGGNDIGRTKSTLAQIPIFRKSFAGFLFWGFGPFGARTAPA